MSFLSGFRGSKILLLGFIFVLLVAIPLTVYILQKQQEVRSRAVAATKLYFTEPGKTTPPLTTLQKTVGETFDLDIIVNPGTNQNQVSFIALNITYDGSKIDAVDSKLRVNETAFPAILKAPSYTSGNASVTISIGADPAKVITAVTKVGTITFKVTAQATTDPTISIAFTGSQVLSIASSDQPSENVLADSTPLLLTIVPAAGATPTAKPGSTPASGQSKAPECTSLNTDRTPSGTAPFALALIANGNDSDGTINKVTFNFGDGPAQDVTQGGGIGTKTVSVQIAHEYKNAGTFKASAVLTDNSGTVSSSTSCTQTITVTGGVGGGAIAPTATAAAAPLAVTPTATAAAKVTITPPGPGGSIVGIGIAGVVLSILGGLLLLAL